MKSGEKSSESCSGKHLPKGRCFFICLLPVLEGTEKQVSWARKIRAGVIRAWEAEHNTFYNEFVTIRRGKVEEESNAYRYKIKHGATPEEAKAAVLEVAETNNTMQLYKRWFETTSAAWIIDNRD